MTLAKKLIITFSAVSLLPFLLLEVIYLHAVSTTLTDTVRNQLESIVTIQHHRLLQILRFNRQNLALLASRSELQWSLDSYLNDGDAAHADTITSILFDAKQAIGEIDCITVMTVGGTPVASTSAALLAETPITSSLIEQAATTGFADDFILLDRQLRRIVASPIIVEDRVIGVIVALANPQGILQLAADHTGLGASGETAIMAANTDGHFHYLLPLRFDQDATFMDVTTLPRHVIDALQSHRQPVVVIDDWLDYRGVRVVAAFHYLPDRHWLIMTKLDRREAYASATRLRILLVCTFVCIGVAVVVIIIRTARSITRPITSLIQTATRIREGDLACRAEGDQSTEIGTLVTTINTLVQDLQESTVSKQLLLDEIEAHKKTERSLVQQRNELAMRTEALKRSNEDLKQFTYMASHDLQGPLRIIGSYIDLLRRRYGDQLDERAHEYIGYVMEGAMRMRQLISDLLDFAQLETSARKFETVDTNDVTQQLIRELSRAADTKAVCVTADSLPVVFGAASQIRQLIQNLISNAVKYNESERPTIHISATPYDTDVRRQLYQNRMSEDLDAVTDALAASPEPVDISPLDASAAQLPMWLFSVADNGIGIDPRYALKIFEVFKRLHGRDEYAGTGIGLAICKRIVQNHNGEIWVKSEVGRGATFYFTLPVSTNDMTSDSELDKA